MKIVFKWMSFLIFCVLVRNGYLWEKTHTVQVRQFPKINRKTVNHPQIYIYAYAFIFLFKVKLSVFKKKKSRTDIFLKLKI